MRKLLLTLALISSVAHAKDKCWESPWVDAPDVNMPLLIQQGYQIKQHSFGTLRIDNGIASGDDYILEKTATSAHCAGSGIFDFSFLCKRKVTHAKVYECEVDEYSDSSRERTIHQCHVLRDADQMRRAPCELGPSK